MLVVDCRLQDIARGIFVGTGERRADRAAGWDRVPKWGGLNGRRGLMSEV